MIRPTTAIENLSRLVRPTWRLPNGLRTLSGTSIGTISREGRFEVKRRRAPIEINAQTPAKTEMQSIPVTPPIAPTPNGLHFPIHQPQRVTSDSPRASFNWLVPVVVLIAGALLYKPAKNRLRPSVMHSIDDGDTLYNRAVARTRQSVHVSRAIIFMNTNAPARAMVELERALNENMICRSELLAANIEQDKLQKLYVMHLRNAEVPPEYSTLLQLREMFGISTDRAIKLEKQLNKTDSFVI